MSADDVPDWLNVSRETEQKLRGLCDLVKKWNPAVNLVAKSTVTDLWQRHVLDSAQIYAFCPQDARSWLDLGSGAGFPGLVVTILADHDRPELAVTLVESDRRKAVFLSEAARTLNLRAKVICDRVELIPPQSSDVVSARALASLTVLCGYSERHLKPDGLGLFPKGASAADEIAEARRHWQFGVESHGSRTDTSASILALKEVRHA